MRKLLYAFKPFLVEILNDLMMAACIIGPIFAGAAFKFLIPELEEFLCQYYGKAAIITPYYAIFDMLIIVMTPIMFCFAGVMVVLEEMDCGVAKYYAVTPLGKGGYLVTRIVFPCIISFVYDMILLRIFSISGMNLVMMLVLSFGGCLLAILTALLVVTLANNKMEGIAIVKLCGILILGIPIPYFVLTPLKYLFGFLPSFWMAKLCITNNYLCAIPMVITAVFFIFLLYSRFRKKLL